MLAPTRSRTIRLGNFITRNVHVKWTIYWRTLTCNVFEKFAWNFNSFFPIFFYIARLYIFCLLVFAVFIHLPSILNTQWPVYHIFIYLLESSFKKKTYIVQSLYLPFQIPSWKMMNYFNVCASKFRLNYVALVEARSAILRALHPRHAIYTSDSAGFILTFARAALFPDASEAQKARAKKMCVLSLSQRRWGLLIRLKICVYANFEKKGALRF